MHNADETAAFDSTGIALQDTAVAAALLDATETRGKESEVRL